LFTRSGRPALVRLPTQWFLLSCTLE